MLADHRDGLSSSSFLAWSSIAQSVCQRAFSLLAIWCLGSRVQILHSAEEDNLSPFDSNFACLCQSIEINNNKYVYRQSQVRKSTDSGVKWAECSLIIGTGCRVQVFIAWSSIAQSVCQWAFSLLAIWCLRPWWVRILLSAEEDNLSPFDSNIACLCQSIEINNNKHVCMYVRMYVEFKFLAWSSIAQYVCQQAFSLLANMCLRPWVRILHSAEKDNLSPFDSNIACLCQSIEINNNKYVYRQSQVRKPTGSEVEWAECLLIIGTGCWVKVLAWSSLAQSVCQQAFSLLANRCLRPWVRILHSAEEDNLSPFDSNIACLCQSIEINNKQYVCAYVRTYACMCVCMRSCLSLEVVSSIPAGLTIIYRFLCGFKCVSLCQSNKIKPTNMYVYMYVCVYVRAYIYIYIYIYGEIGVGGGGGGGGGGYFHYHWAIYDLCKYSNTLHCGLKVVSCLHLLFIWGRQGCVLTGRTSTSCTMTMSRNGKEYAHVPAKQLRTYMGLRYILFISHLHIIQKDWKYSTTYP